LAAYVTNSAVVMIALLSGGYHDLPVNFSSIFSQKYLSSLIDLLHNLTLILLFQPGIVFKSTYNIIKWYLALGIASEVDYK
jgi:hypothetical protein